MKKLLLLMLVSFSACSQNGETIDTADSRLSYRTFGSGQPLLIINGGPGMNSDGFVPLAEKLSENNLAILYDQRGTGKSTLKNSSADTMAMDLLVSDIETLRKHLKLEKWIVLGHSFGGMLASYYATKHPDRIDKLILSSSGGIDLNLLTYVGDRTNKLLTKQQRDSLAYWNRKLNSGDTSYTARIGRGRALAPAYVYNKKNVPEIAERLTQGNMQINRMLWEDMRRIGFDCKEKLAGFKQPVLVIAGKNDLLDIETAKRSHKAFPNSKLVLLDKCGHYGWLDREDDYLDEIHNFLKAD